MNKNQKLLLMTAVLRKGKTLVPDRFPQPNPETIKSWSDALDKLMESLPDVSLWEEAITVWSVELVGDRMATPRDIKHAVHVVRDRWEGDPVKSRVLADARAERQALHDRQIAEGIRGESIGYRPPAALGGSPERRPENVTSDAKARWRDIVGKFKTGEVV